MKHIKKIKIDIDKKNLETISSVQYDSNTRFLHISLVNNSLPLNLTGCNIRISAIKPDNTTIFNNCTIIDAKQGFIEAELTEQINAALGNVKCELKIYSENGVLTTKTFDIEVTAPITSKEITSSHEFRALTEALSTIDTWHNFKANGGTIGGPLDILNISANRIISLENHNSLDIVLKDKHGNYYCTPVKIGDFGLEVFGDIFAGGHNLGAEGKQFNIAFIGDFLRSETGFTSLPNGMLIQWGYVFVGGPNGSQITFPTRFTTTEPVITISPMSNELNEYQQSAWITGWNQYNFYARCSSETNCKWIAIGY